MTALTPAQVRERVVAGNHVCADGPEVEVVDLVPGEGPSAAVRVYESEAAMATLVYAHGGGWVTGDLEYTDELCRFLADGGLRVVSVDYRLAPEHRFPAGLDDLADAWAWARGRYGDAPVGLGGDSAGANLATVVALLSADTAPSSFLLLLYPVLTTPGSTPSYQTRGTAFPIGLADMRWFLAHYVDEADSADVRIFPLSSPHLDQLPRTHLVLAGHDPLHDEGVALADALEKTGVPVTADRYDDLCHGFLRFTGVSPRARAARDATVEAALRLARDARVHP